MNSVWNLSTLHTCNRVEYKKNPAQREKNQANFKSIVSETVFFKDFTRAKKIQEFEKKLCKFV